MYKRATPWTVPNDGSQADGIEGKVDGSIFRYIEIYKLTCRSTWGGFLVGGYPGLDECAELGDRQEA